MDDNKINLFSTPVWGFILKEERYQSKDYIDTINQLEITSPSVQLSNYGGYQTQANLQELPVFKELVTSIETLGSKIFKSLGYIGDAVVTEMWGNINYKFNFNGSHTHGESLSGVFYLQTPPSCGKLLLINPSVRSDGRLFRAPNFPITPEPLGLIIFPSWLEHYVEPNLSEEKRISISFNMGLRA